MRRTTRSGGWVLGVAVAVAAMAAGPASATTLIRTGLETLVESNGTIVVGEVLEAHSYWNDEGTFILTDVVVGPEEVLKGDGGPHEVTVTIMGGSVGELTTLIVGGAELVPGESYVLFLDRGELPGVQEALTIRDHSQGVFEVQSRAQGRRAVSQAAGHPLFPDGAGVTEPPGGREGMALEELVRSIRELATPAQRPDARGEVP